MTVDGQSFLIEGEDLSDTSHTGEYLACMLLKTMDLVRWSLFSGITSNNTGNTHLARQLVSREVKTCIPMSDVCHHLNLLAKDLAKLDIFKDMINDLHVVITFFHKSTQATDALETSQKMLGISCGLEGIGKTHFATICTAAISLKQCFPALRELNDKHSLKFLPKKVMILNLFKSGVIGLTFEMNINQFVQVEGPIAKSIVCLESTQSNPADVYKYWIAICGSIKQVLDDPANGFTTKDAGIIRRVVNARFHEQLQDDPVDCYLAAFALEPRK
ncbi:hypothetical protein OG21DRAFT_1479398 [Imleria badia]|nr:hypothetical protein OG21DRAFT_1479398 [Imleria badia]